MLSSTLGSWLVATVVATIYGYFTYQHGYARGCSESTQCISEALEHANVIKPERFLKVITDYERYLEEEEG